MKTKTMRPRKRTPQEVAQEAQAMRNLYAWGLSQGIDKWEMDRLVESDLHSVNPQYRPKVVAEYGTSVYDWILRAKDARDKRIWEHHAKKEWLEQMSPEDKAAIEAAIDAQHAINEPLRLAADAQWLKERDEKWAQDKKEHDEYMAQHPEKVKERDEEIARAKKANEEYWTRYPAERPPVRVPTPPEDPEVIAEREREQKRVISQIHRNVLAGQTWLAMWFAYRDEAWKLHQAAKDQYQPILAAAEVDDTPDEFVQ